MDQAMPPRRELAGEPTPAAIGIDDHDGPRSAGMAALVAFVAVGAVAILIGQRHVSQWREAIATATQAQDKYLGSSGGIGLDRPAQSLDIVTIQVTIAAQ